MCETKGIPLHPREGFHTKTPFIRHATSLPWTTALRRPLDRGVPLQISLASLLPQLPLQAACPVWVTGAQHSHAQLHAVYYRTKVMLTVERQAKEKQSRSGCNNTVFMNLCIRNKLRPVSALRTEQCSLPDAKSVIKCPSCLHVQNIKNHSSGPGNAPVCNGPASGCKHFMVCMDN